MKKDKGKTFGHGYEIERKRYFNELKYLYDPILHTYIPGPGTYKINTEFAQKQKGKTIGLREPTPKHWQFPSASEYTPKPCLSTRYQSISFGFGKKIDITKAPTITPGPGQYDFHSKFDKFSKGKFWKFT